jgi:hypothetical protein
MIKYILPAAIAAIALGTVAGASLAHAQMAQPMQQPMPNGNMSNANVVITGQPQPGPDDYATQGYAQPMIGQPTQPMPGQFAQPISPRTTWIPGHYNWDPNTSNYVWAEGQYAEAPTATAQWVPGHWVETPSSWIWIEGGWH